MRQCLVEKDHLVKPDPTIRPITSRPDINIDIDRIIPIQTTQSPDDKNADTDTPVIYIISGIMVILVIIIAFLLFCLCSKRDLSCCPAKSDFGRRYTQVRGNVRKSVMYLRRQVTLRKNAEDRQRLGTTFENDSPANTPDALRKFAPSRQAPTLPSVNSSQPPPYTTPSTQMIPKVKKQNKRLVLLSKITIPDKAEKARTRSRTNFRSTKGKQLFIR